MVSRTELQTMVQRSRERYDAAVEGIDDAALESQPVCGVWSARDVAGHVADWNIELQGAAEHALGRSSDSRPVIEDGEAFNASHADARKSQSWSEAKADLDASFDRAGALLDEISDDQLSATGTYPWGSEGTVLGLMHSIAEHADEHVVDLEHDLKSQ